MGHVHARCRLLQPVASERRLRAGFLRRPSRNLSFDKGAGFDLKKAEWLVDTQGVDQSGRKFEHLADRQCLPGHDHALLIQRQQIPLTEEWLE